MISCPIRKWWVQDSNAQIHINWILTTAPAFSVIEKNNNLSLGVELGKDKRKNRE